MTTYGSVSERENDRLLAVCREKEAEIARLEAELERCKRAVEWCIQNSPHWDSAGLLWIDPAQINDYSRGEIPAEFADIICGRKE